MKASPHHSSASAFPYSRGLHLVALLTACSVFPLIFVGAGVTSKDAGMAYPDGFTSDGYLLRNPPGWWDSDNTRWEHGHRLLGRSVGVLAIVVAIWAWRFGGSIRVLAVGSLAAICIQGTLGAFRVYEVSTGLAMIHGIMGQVCFCLTCVVALVTGRSWSSESIAQEIPDARLLQKLCTASAICVFAQLMMGAGYRHFACSWSLMFHVFGAIVATCLVGWVAMWVAGSGQVKPLISRLGMAIGVLMVFQLLLGGAAFTVVVMGTSKSSLILWLVPTAHAAIGALLFAGTVLLMLCTKKMLRPVPAESVVEASAAVVTS